MFVVGVLDNTYKGNASIFPIFTIGTVFRLTSLMQLRLIVLETNLINKI